MLNRTAGWICDAVPDDEESRIPGNALRVESVPYKKSRVLQTTLGAPLFCLDTRELVKARQGGASGSASIFKTVLRRTS